MMITTHDDYFARIAWMVACKRAIERTTDPNKLEQLTLHYEWLRDGELPPEKAKRKAILDAQLKTK